jgi:hypothetical protein
MNPAILRTQMAALGWLLLAIAIWLLLRDSALAQGAPTSQSFRCSGTTASGSLIASAASCPSILTKSNVFSFLVCHVEAITSQVFGNLYCGVITQLKPAISAVLTLAVLFFGVGFTIGIIPATGREALLFLLKIAFVWAFATNADYMIGYGYNFFVAGLREGTAIAVSALFTSTTSSSGTGVAAMYGQLDQILVKIFGFITDSAGAAWGSAGSNPCKNAIFAAIAVMGIAFPPLFLISLLLFFKIIMVFLRACFGYMFSIVGIAFLMTLSPIFLSMALFKQTRAHFDKYLGYLTSFALQMVIIFSFLATVLSMNVSSLANSFVNLVVPVQEAPTSAAMRWPWQYCTLCKFEIRDWNGNVKDFSKQPRPAIDIANDYATCKVPNSTDPKDQFTILRTVTPDTETNDINILMQFTGTAIISLLILAYVVDRLLDYAPAIAWRLASGITGGGSTLNTPQIGGGATYGAPAVTFGPIGYMETAGEGFVRGFTSRTEGGGNSLSGLAAGSAEAKRSLLFGHGRDEGIIQGFTRFFINPQRGSGDS